MATIRNKKLTEAQLAERRLQKKAQKRKAGVENNTEHSYLSALLLIGAALLSAALLFTAFGARTVPTANEAFEIVTSLFEDQATMVHSEHVKTPKRSVVVWKHCHGGPTSIGKLIKDKVELRNYLSHQEQTFQAQKALVEKFGCEHFLCFIEGSADVDGHEILRKHAELNKMKAQLGGLLDIHDLSDASIEKVRSILANAGSQAEGALRLFGWQMQFIEYLEQEHPEDGWKAVRGADIPNYNTLSTRIVSDFLALANLPRTPSDSESDAFLQSMREAEDGDTRARHEYLMKELLKTDPKKICCSIVLGGSHSGFGSRAEKTPTDYPIEGYLLAAQFANVQTWEDKYYKELVRPTKYVLSHDTTREELQAMLEALRNAR